MDAANGATSTQPRIVVRFGRRFAVGGRAWLWRKCFGEVQKIFRACRRCGLTSTRTGGNFHFSMQEIIEKLLILQDRDRKILRVSQELAHIGPERDGLRARATTTQGQLQAAKLRVNQIESERKQRDLEIEAKKSQIEKYLNQQLLDRKSVVEGKSVDL